MFEDPVFIGNWLQIQMLADAPHLVDVELTLRLVFRAKHQITIFFDDRPFAIRLDAERSGHADRHRVARLEAFGGVFLAHGGLRIYVMYIQINWAKSIE